MKKLVVLSSISLLAAVMATNVWAEKTDAAADKGTATDIAKPEAPKAPEAPAAPDSDKKAADSTAAGDEKSASTPAAATPELYIISPKNGDEVTSPVTVVFGLKGMGVAPAGVEKDNTGHHHLLIDQAELPAEGVPMGADVQHFGGGQTQTEIELDAGEHSLQLILGDMAHVPLSPILSSEKITVKVK